ncbi:Ig-like domain-containing protein, partial [Staphylococcus microti]
TTVTDVTPTGTIDTNTPGDYTGKVEVTYPDGSKDTVDVPVTVKEKLTDADQNDPKVTPEEVDKGGKVDLTDNVDLTDLPEGTTVTDVTPAGTIDTDKPGDYTGKVEVTYPDGSKDTVDVPVKVNPSQADENDPEVTPEVVEKGQDVDLTDNVDLTKLPDGTKVTDVTPTGTIDTNTPGDYTGKVEITYPDGSKETVDVPVTVKEKLTDADQNDPKVTPEEVEKGGDVDLTDNVDLTDLPEGTKVVDVTPEGTIDTDKPGDYTGVVEVVYPDGSKDTVEVPVKVQDTVAPDAPTVTNPQPGDKVITGTAEPNGTVDVTLPNGDVIKDVPVNADGEYTVDVPEGVDLKEGDKVTVVAKDDSGNVSDPTEGTVTDTVAPDAPTVTNPQPGDKVITGTAEPNGTVDVTLPNGDVIKDVPVDAEGNYKVDVPEGVDLKEGDKVTVVAKDDNGNTSTPTEGKVTDTVAPDAPTITNPQPGDKVITGTAEPNGTVDVTLPNGDVIKDVPVDENGNWKVDVPEGVDLKEGDKVTVVAKDGNGNTSTPTEGKVTDTVAPDAPTVNPVKPGDKVVTGKGEPGSTITVKFPDGKEGTATVDKDGNWTVKVPDGTVIKPGDELDVTATDEAGNKSDVTKVKVPDTDKDTVAPDQPTVNPVNPGDKTVTGKGEPGSTITVKFPDGKEGTTTVDKDGNWTVKVPDGTVIKAGDKLIVTATDEAGNTSEPTVVIVKGKDNGMTGMDKGDKANDMGNMDNASNTDKAMKDDMKASKDMNNKGKEMKELPDTGNESTNAPLFGSLIAALGSLFLFGRRRKEKEEK